MMIRLINAAGAMLDLPDTISWRSVPLGVTVPQLVLAGRPGAAHPGEDVVNARSFELRGSIYHPDPAQIRTMYDTLAAFLQQSPHQVYQHHTDTRFLVARWAGAPQDWIDARRELQLRIPMVALDPYWYDEERTSEETITASPHEWTVESIGSVEACPVVRFEFGAACSDPWIEHVETGQAVGLSGVLESGDALVFDGLRYTATLIRAGLEEPVLDRAIERWLRGGFALQPGTNTLRFLASGETIDVTARLTWRPRWL